MQRERDTLPMILFILLTPKIDDHLYPITTNEYSVQSTSPASLLKAIPTDSDMGPFHFCQFSEFQAVAFQTEKDMITYLTYTSISSGFLVNVKTGDIKVIKQTEVEKTVQQKVFDHYEFTLNEMENE